MYIFSYIFSEVSPIQLYPDQALSGTEFFISSPVRPGSTYIMRYWNTPRDYAVTFTEEDSLLTVNVPKEPGLYFFGCYDAKKSLEKGTLKELGNSARWNKRILVEALRRYKGTVWEEYIRAELDKL